MTDQERKAAKEAAKVLANALSIDFNDKRDWYSYKHDVEYAANLLRQALAQNPLDIADRAYFAGKQAGIEETLAQPEQEPVAWMYDFLNSDNRDEVIRNWVTQDIADIEREKGFNVRPLYAAPPSKTWVSLTDEEMGELYDKTIIADIKDYAKAIEANLRIKNGY